MRPSEIRYPAYVADLRGQYEADEITAKGLSDTLDRLDEIAETAMATEYRDEDGAE